MNSNRTLGEPHSNSRQNRRVSNATETQLIGAQRPEQERCDRVGVDSATIEHDHEFLVRHHSDALPAASHGFVNRRLPRRVAAASYLPARRVTRIHPVEALRAE